MKRFLLLLILSLPAAATATAQQIPGGYERVLLPIFTRPISGAYGSDFRSDFKLMNRGNQALTGYGLEWQCIITCPSNPLLEFELEPGSVEEPTDYLKHGKPGVFIHLPADRIDDVVMQLRAYDFSREATNFGTEIPVVREGDMRREPITLIGVPGDPRFRKTLRIYGTYGWIVDVTVEGNGYRAKHQVELAEPQSPLEPAYGVFTEFPSNVGPVRVTVDAPPADILIDPLPPPPAIWAFVSITNNDTQHITVVSPQK